MNTTAAQQLAETLEQLSAEPRCAFLHFGLLSIDTRLQDTHPAADVLGTGGAAKVYRGRLRGNKPVAIKMIWSVDITAEIVRQFKAEVMMLARLARHRNVVQVEGYSVMPPAFVSLWSFATGAPLRPLLRGARLRAYPRRPRRTNPPPPPSRARAGSTPGERGERERVRGSVESAGGLSWRMATTATKRRECFLVANLDDDPSGTGVGAGAFYNDDNNEEDDWLGDYRRRPSVASSVGPPQQPRPQPQPQPQLQPPRQCVNSAVVETARRRAAAAAATARERQCSRREGRWERREQERKPRAHFSIGGGYGGTSAVRIATTVVAVIAAARSRRDVFPPMTGATAELALTTLVPVLSRAVGLSKAASMAFSTSVSTKAKRRG